MRVLLSITNALFYQPTSHNTIYVHEQAMKSVLGEKYRLKETKQLLNRVYAMREQYSGEVKPAVIITGMLLLLFACVFAFVLVHVSYWLL